MANIFEKFMNSMKLYDEDDEYEEDDMDLEEDEEEPAPAPRFGRRTPKTEKFRYEEEEPQPSFRRPEPEPEPEPQPRPVREEGSAPKAKKPNVVNMRGKSSGFGSKSYEVCMIRPEKLDDAREICDTLMAGRAVVINLECVHGDLSQRIIDFTSGACYSVQGNMQHISKRIIIVSPASINLTGDFQDDNSMLQHDLDALKLE